MISRERLRQILAEEEITFQRTKTWKESPDPLREQKLTRIEYLLEHERDRTFAFDEFGPLAIKPEGGSCWAEKSRPQRLRANYHKPHGTRQLFAWYSIGADRLYGRIEPRKGARPTLRALKAIRAPVPDGEPIYVILDNLNHHKGTDAPPVVRGQRRRAGVHPDLWVLGQPDRGPLRPAPPVHHRQLRLPEPRRAGQGHPQLHPLAQRQHPDPEVLALERKHRAMLRGEAQRRWGQPRARAA